MNSSDNAPFTMGERNKYIQPWKTVIARINVADKFDMDMVASEIFSLDAEWDTDKADNEGISEELTPNIIAIRDHHITPAIIDYIREIYCVEITREMMHVHTKGLTLKDRGFVGPHVHSAANFTTVMYPHDSSSSLFLTDPRGNACRGFPKDIRFNSFDDFEIKPKAGDVYIMPSYIPHFVVPVDREFRATLVNDYFLDYK